MQFHHKVQKNNMLHAKIGSIFFLLLCCVQTCAEQIQLRIVSEQGRPIQRIPVGAPCMLEVIIPGSVTIQKRPVIAGIDRSQIIREQESMQMYIRNGVTMQERTISYLVSFPEVGTVHIGPARVETSQGELVSSPVTLEVQETSPQQTPQVRAELQLAKTSAYISEAIPYTIKFYYSEDAVGRVGLQQFYVADCKIVQSDAVCKNTFEKNNVHYTSLEWSGIIYPQKAGRITIPRIYFEYTESASHAQQHQWAQFMHVMGGFFSRKQQNTEPVTLHVQQLPTTTEQVVGVGTIADVAMTCSSTALTQGESLTCQVRIEGAFDPDALQVPPLQVPDTVRVYPSQTQSSGTYPHTTKTYEYIVQALDAGSLEIPAQRYCFFDPQSERYTFFTTAPHKLYVIPAVHAPEELTQDSEKSEDPEVLAQTATGTAEQSAPDYVPLPLRRFLLLLLLPVVWVCIRKYIYGWYATAQTKRERTRIMRMVRRDLHGAVEHNNPYAFLKSWNMFEQTIDPTHYLKEDELVAWYALQDKLSEAAFFAANKQQLQQLLQHAETILNTIESRMKKG